MQLSPMAGRNPRPAVLVAASAAMTAVGLLVLASCAATAPAPPPAPAPAPAPVPVPEEAPLPATVYVTGSRLNVREAPSRSARTVAKVARGTALQAESREGEWYRVSLDDGARGWVHADYVSLEPPRGRPGVAPEAPCPPDSTDPVVVSAPPVSFVQNAPHGRVVVEATVSRRGDVTAARVTENTTASEDLAQLAVSEVKQMTFAPYVRGCRAVPFIYVFTRTF